MKRYLLSAAAIAALCCSATLATAEDGSNMQPPAMEGHGDHPMMGKGDGMKGKGEGMGGRHMEAPKSRSEAIQKTKEHLAKLEGMSDDDWQKMHDQRMEHREKWKEMSPEERQQMKDKYKEMRDKRGEMGGAPDSKSE